MVLAPSLYPIFRAQIQMKAPYRSFDTGCWKDSKIIR